MYTEVHQARRCTLYEYIVNAHNNGIYRRYQTRPDTDPSGFRNDVEQTLNENPMELSNHKSLDVLKYGVMITTLAFTQIEYHKVYFED